MSVINDLLVAILDRPFDESTRAHLRDELIAADSWEWSFLQKLVLARPDSDGPRLMAADWLDEQEKEIWAAFIRLQCRLSRSLDIGGGNAETAQLTDEVFRLARKLRPKLIRDADLLPPESELTFDGECVSIQSGEMKLDFLRGFLTRIELPTNLFLDRAQSIFANHPITTVRLIDKCPMPVMGRAWWWADSCLAPSEPACLARYVPPEIYQVLTGSVTSDGRQRPGVNPADLTFPTAAAANLALSNACVGYGRMLANASTSR